MKEFLPFSMREWVNVCSSYKYGSDIGLERLSNQSKFVLIQLTVFVGGICLRSKNFFNAVFSKEFFTRKHFKELQVKGNLFDCSQIWTVTSLI